MNRCPFCDVADSRVVSKFDKVGNWITDCVVCNYCGARGPGEGCHLDAEKSWNKRDEE